MSGPSNHKIILAFRRCLGQNCSRMLRRYILALDEHLRDCSSGHTQPQLINQKVHSEDPCGHLSRYAAIFECQEVLQTNTNLYCLGIHV